MVGYSQQRDLFLKAKELVSSNPDEAIKIGEHILRTSQITSEKVKASLLISNSYKAKGEYNSAIISAFEGGELADNPDLKTKAELYLLKAELLRRLYLDDQSETYVALVEEMIGQVAPKVIKDSLELQVAMEKISMALDRRNNEQAFTLIQATDSKFKEFLNRNQKEKLKLLIAYERVLINMIDYDEAQDYIHEALKLLDSIKGNSNLVQEARLYNDLGYVLLQKKDFEESEENLFIALKHAELLQNTTLLKEINRNLAINYLGSNQKSKHQVFNDEFLVLNNKVELLEQESINTVYNILSIQNEQILKEQENKYKKQTYFYVFGLIVIIIIGLLILLRSFWAKKRLKEIINYLEISRNNFTVAKPTKKTKTKPITIPEETEQSLLIKLNRFENSKKYLNKDMSLAVLAAQFETNTKYLSEIINNHYNDNFNTFINKLRINFIIDKLKNDPNYINYKISFLAEESGFSSHSSFATVFKSIIGMSPAKFISMLKEEQTTLKETNNK